MATRLVVLGIFFASGAAGLIYEILWMRQLTQLFGSTSQSAAVTTAAFFAGLAAGSHFWGARSRTLQSPLRTYAVLEFGIVVLASLYYVLVQASFVVYGVLFAWFAATPWFIVIKLLLALLLIFPASFLMGGTLPVMGQYLIRDRASLGRWAGLLYGLNTLGAVAGALAAGFYLPRILGLQGAYGVALGLSALVGTVALFIAREPAVAPAFSGVPASPRRPVAPAAGFSPGLLRMLAGLSGFVSLGMQVLWTRMFVQVLQNSTYTFASILVIFLLSLALGAFLVRLMYRWLPPAASTLAALFQAGGLLCLLSAFFFHFRTNGLAYLGDQAPLTGYLIQVLVNTGIIIGPAILIMGMILPLLYRFAESQEDAPGAIVGSLNGWNTVGAIAGSLLAGFVLIPVLGLWPSLLLLALIYLVTGFILVQSQVWRLGTAATLVLAVVLLNPASLPLVRIDPEEEQLLKVWEGSDGTVSVVRRDGNLRVKMNNWYALGGSGALRTERIQTHLPMHLHADAKSLFYLGMGSGITAGAVLDYPVDKVVVTELSAEIIAASEAYFEPYTNDLHNDPRVTVVHADGRNYLMGSNATYDLIIADLFVPWRAGVALLYTREHFANARSRLNPGGLFVQWVPLYQVSERELQVIAKTLVSVFPQVTAWRGDFYAEKPILALVGHREAGPLPANAPIVVRSREELRNYHAGEAAQIPLIAHYLGQLELDMPWLQGVTVNTDNRPILEFIAPESHRAERAGLLTWFTGTPMIELMQSLQQYREPVDDPYLENLPAEMQRAVYAGLLFHLAAVAGQTDDEDTRQRALEAGKQLLRRP